jgi:integrase
MFRRSGPATLGAYARDYGLLRDVRPETLRQYQISADLFERWAGGPVRLEELDEQSVSAFLRDYSATAAPPTVRSKRTQILALWRAAADDGLCDPPTRRVRSVRVPRRPVVAWERAEVERLLAACQALPRWHRCGLRRSVWWDLAIRVAWDTGLRWGDLVALPVEAVRADGAVVWSQAKTGSLITCRLQPSTLAALLASLEACPRSLVCPWPASHETFTDQVARLVKKAGVRPGTWKWIRRGSGTDVELQQGGAGHLHLGNTRAVFESAYGDRAILGRAAPHPRELLVEALARRPVTRSPAPCADARPPAPRLARAEARTPPPQAAG